MTPLTTAAGLVEEHLTGDGPGGGQVVMTRHGSAVVDLAFGACPVTGRPIDAETRFPWYSATKPVAATALHRLVEQGAVRYDDRVAQHLPEFAAQGKSEVTLRQVLTHTGGFPDLAGRIDLALFADRAALRAAVCDLPLEQPPGADVTYHAVTATAVLALVAEAVSGTDFEDLVRSTVLTPGGMSTTGWHPDATTTHVRALTAEGQQVADSIRTATMTAVLPGGGLYGSARDLAAFYDELAGGTLLTPATVAEMSRLAVPFSPGRTLGFGLHVMVGCDAAMPVSRGTAWSPGVFGHPGWWCTLGLHDPATATTVVVLTNVALEQDDSDARLARACDLLLAGA